MIALQIGPLHLTLYAYIKPVAQIFANEHIEKCIDEEKFRILYENILVLF